jgi:hypothetical protein
MVSAAAIAYHAIIGLAKTGAEDARSMALGMDVTPTFSALRGASPDRGAFCFQLKNTGDNKR